MLTQQKIVRTPFAERSRGYAIEASALLDAVPIKANEKPDSYLDAIVLACSRQL